MKLSICVQTEEVPQTIPGARFFGTFAERARKARQAGADGLELMTVDPRALSAQAVADALRDNGLQAVAIGSGAVASGTGLTLLNPDTAAAARAKTLANELIEFAAALGAPLVTIGSFADRVATCGPDGRARLADILWGLAQRAESAGVRPHRLPGHHRHAERGRPLRLSFGRTSRAAGWE